MCSQYSDEIWLHLNIVMVWWQDYHEPCIHDTSMCMLSRNSLLPRPALFFVLLFGLTITHRSRRAEKKGEGLGAFITWMMSGGYEVDVGGVGSVVDSTCLHWVHCRVRYKHFTARLDSRCYGQLRSAMFKLTYIHSMSLTWRILPVLLCLLPLLHSSGYMH